jgi:beta-carotene/zeaxanthin 4-ketolase
MVPASLRLMDALKKCQGLIFACLIFTGWLFSMWTGLFLLPPGFAALPSKITIFLLVMFFSTGLFITAHDGMHGTIVPFSRRLNDLFGSLAVRLYALFSFSHLQHYHWKHHERPGTSYDPDFSLAYSTSFWRWYIEFLKRYLSVTQVIGMAILANILIHVYEIPTSQVITLWALPALCSSLQLFYFGTYLPHKPGITPFPDNHNARSLQQTRVASFFSCFHFGCHELHHRSPSIPWWCLWSVEAKSTNKDLCERFDSREVS